jgi:hypothetical protein
MRINFTRFIASALVCGSLAAADDAPTPMGLFGISPSHVNNRSAGDAARWVPLMQSIGIRHYRAAATGWGLIEPKQGEFSWKELDAQMDYLAAHGIEFGGMFNGNVAWNEKDARGTLPVNNLEAWAAHVTALVTHTKGRIRRWEVWNEPPNGTGRDQTPADYAKIVISAYDAAKAVDPDCLIGLAAKSAHITYLEQTIAAGAKDHFDYITLHPYEVLNGIADNAGTEAVFLNIVPALRKMLRSVNPENADVPVIFSELGCDVRRGEDTQAHALVKAFAMGAAQGVECVQWFEGRDGDSGPLGLIDAKGQPRPAYTAMWQLIRHLGQRPKYLGWVQFQDRHPGFLFQGAETTVLVAWGQKDSADEIDFGKKVAITNPLTGSTKTADRHLLSVAPVLILGVSEDLRKQAAANREKPYRWGGDYSSVDSVSLTMGADRVEAGLHTLSGDSVAQAVVAYGGSARAGSVPGGNLFIVDPGFLSYDTDPIEIAVTVRRNEANTNAGFKLVYESPDGFKTAASGWYTIPDNQKWHTKRFRVEDPRFVNYWGYNFALESDGDQFNQYFLQSVTVTKLKGGRGGKSEPAR